jgi:hypothetical protein
LLTVHRDLAAGAAAAVRRSLTAGMAGETLADAG